MTGQKYISANVLPTVMIMSVIMLLIILGLILLWQSNSFLFSKVIYNRNQENNIYSYFKLYCSHPEISESLNEGLRFQLYDSLSSSKVIALHEKWGLYEVLTVSSESEKIKKTAILGLSSPFQDTCNFWYKENLSVLTLTGNSFIRGKVRLPQNGIVYGQMQSVSFSGEEISAENIKVSQNEMPEIISASKDLIREYFDMNEYTTSEIKSSMTVPFFSEHEIINIGSGLLQGIDLRGKIMLMGDQVHFDSSCRIEDIIVIARKVNISDHFHGSLQIFANDSIIIGKNAVLHYPSGIYSEKYIEIADSAVINGYAIVISDDESSQKEANFVKSRTSRLRGFMYVKGVAQPQGVTTGVSFIDQATLYTDHGSYKNLIYDACFLESPKISFPFFLSDEGPRKILKFVN